MAELKKLVEAGVHFGHHTSRWHPKMRPYIWGARNKTHLINVAKTAFLLNRAEKFLQSAAESGKHVLWVGTKRPAQDLIRSTAEKIDMPFVAHRWIGGSLSNFDQVKKAVTRLLHLQDVKSKSLARYTKKEQSMITKEIERLEKNVGGIVSMTDLPAAIVVVDAKKEQAVIKEANGVGIPVVCLVDTNTDPSGVAYLIPGNDDSPKSIGLILECLSQAVAKGSEKAKEAKAKAEALKAAEKEAKASAKKAAAKKAADKVEAAAPAKEVEVKKAAPKKAAAKKADKKATKATATKDKADAKADKAATKPATKKAAAASKEK